jgi:hypothetical protein
MALRRSKRLKANIGSDATSSHSCSTKSASPAQEDDRDSTVTGPDLSSLPQEIKEMIYLEVVLDPERAVVQVGCSWDVSLKAGAPRWRVATVHPLALTCKQIYKDLVPIFYKEVCSPTSGSR